MDLRHITQELQKVRSLNIFFQNILGELTLYMNNSLIIQNSSTETVSLFLKVLQNFLCHNYYLEYINQKNSKTVIQEVNESNNIKLNTGNSCSIYDNSINLILVISAKISNTNVEYTKLIIKCFIEHINNHLDCFNYIISFYRLYNNHSHIRHISRQNGLYNDLFEFYKLIYKQSIKYESSLKDFSNSRKICDGKNEKKFFIENFTKRMQSEIIEDKQSIATNLPVFNKGIIPKRNEKNSKQHRFSIFNSFKISNKSSDFSKTERRENKNLSNDLSAGRDDNTKIKKKIPELRIPIKTLEQHVSLNRSSGRNEFSKSGAGSSTDHTKGVNQKNASIIKLSKNEILICDSSSMNRRHSNCEDDINITPKEKLRVLALQLGECCLASDFASLMNQKRDLELGKIARDKIFKRDIKSSPNKLAQNNLVSEYINKLRSEKLVNEVHEFNFNINSFNNNQTQLTNLLNKKPFLLTKESIDVNLNSNCVSLNNIMDFTKDYKKNFNISFDNQIPLGINIDKGYKNFIKIREIISNFILSCLRDYSLEELSLLKINTNLIYCFLILPSLTLVRKKSERKKYENLEYLQEFSRDTKGLYTEGSYILTDNKDNMFKSIMLNTLDKSQTINEEMMKNIRPNFLSREKPTLDSFLSINFDEERRSLSLKSEIEALNEILCIYSSNVENIIKQQNFFKSIFYSIENPEPEKIEFWNNGILFDTFSRIVIERVRSKSDNFLEKIKNRITYILKNIGLRNNLCELKVQFEILHDYIIFCKSKITPIHIIFEFIEIFIIIKKCFIEIISTNGPFEINNNGIKLIEKSNYNDYKLDDVLLESFTAYLDLIAKITINTQIFTCEKLINELFILCPSLSEVIKFIIIYIYTKDLSERPNLAKTSLSIRSSTDTNNNSMKLTLINFIKEIDSSNISNISYLDKIYDTYKDYLQMAMLLNTYLYNITIFYHKIIRKENLERSKNDDNEFNKYWVDSIRKYTKILYFFINPKNGIFYEYISIYGSYIRMNSKHLLLNTREREVSQSEKQNPIINFALTRAILNLFQSTFEFHHKFSFIVNENTSLDIIRIHYICFIKLYNKNMDLQTKIGDLSEILHNYDSFEKKKRIKSMIKDIYDDQNHISVIINLCKLHLRCLFALANNRNSDTTNKFFQLKIVEFMVKELDLEHDAQEKIYRIKKNMELKQNNNEDSKEDSKEDSYRVSNSNFKNLSLNKSEIEASMKEQVEQPNKSINDLKNDIVLELCEEVASKNSIKKVNSNRYNVTDSKMDSSFNIKKATSVDVPAESNKLNYDNSCQTKSIKESYDLEHENEHNSNDEDFEDDEDYDSDLSDIMLVDMKPRINQYEDKIPKLSLIPNTISDLSLGGAMSKQFPKIEFKSDFTVKNENSLTNNNLKNINNTIKKPENLKIDCSTEKDVINKTDLKVPLENNKLSILNLKVIQTYSDNSVKKSSRRSGNSKNNPEENSIQNFNKLNFKTIEVKGESVEKNINFVKDETHLVNVDLNNSKNIKLNTLGNQQEFIKKDVKVTKLLPEVNKTEEDLKISSLKNYAEKSLEKSISKHNNSKIQLAFENMLKKKYCLFYRKATMEELNEKDLSNLNLFYFKEKNSRLLYHDLELHVLIISLVMCLIIQPTRGTLDELYCSYYPSYESNRVNILYLLHHHLNHVDNIDIQPTLLKYIAEIKPSGAGQRLIKLLCTNLFDISFYTNWTKIAFGAYGKVYECNTNFLEPKTVAIKQIAVAENIYDFCHLFDVFTEITALEAFRMEGCVTHLFDYGVDREHYYIVMKKYEMSLKQWRLQQTGSLPEMLPTYLNIFRDILKAVGSIHNHKTTHYDLKCDNVVIDFISRDRDTLNSPDEVTLNNETFISVKIADLGECKMFLNEKDEYCMRSRGTNVIKSPEMLKNYGFKPKTDDDNYDRRKKIGTTRASDIWSLGCLFYEILTGKFLFEEIETDYFGFMYKTETMSTSELLCAEKIKDINNNQYITDFLKFILVKDQNYRPNIETITKRFEHVHALLVNDGFFGISNLSENILMYSSKVDTPSCLYQSINICSDLLNNASDDYVVNYNDLRLKNLPNLIKITEEIYVSNYHYVENNFDFIYDLGVTHVISWTKTKNKEAEKIFFLNLIENSQESKKSIFNHLFKIMDFLRHCMVYRGITLFVDDYGFINQQAKPDFLMRSLIILSVAYMLNLSAYDAYTYINSKILFFWITPESLTSLSKWVLNHSLINNFIFSHPVIRCLCGACIMVVKRNFSNINLMNLKTCNCSQKSKNTESSECPSNGCQDYILDIKKSYGLNYEYLQWGNFTHEDFIVGPRDLNFSGNPHIKKIVSCSRGLDENLIKHSMNEKKTIKLTMKKIIWDLYKCRICQVWMYGENHENYQVLVNNIHNFNKKAENKKILIQSNNLKNLKLSKLI